MFLNNPLRLGVSTSAFMYTMPKEVLAALRSPNPPKFNDHLNSLMEGFMHELVSAAKKTGIRTLECYHNLSYDSDSVLKILQNTPEIEFWSIHSPYGDFFDPSSPDESIRKDAVMAYCNAVDVARRLGAKLIVAHPGAQVDYDAPRESRIEFTIETLRRIADYAGENGIKVAVEPLPKDEVGNTLEELMDVIDQIDRPNVGINFDVNHLFPASAIPSLIRKAGSLIMSAHISDQDDQERHWLPFRGKLDWKEVLSALIEAGYRGPLIYETHIKDAANCNEVGKTIVENYQKLIKLAPDAISNNC